MNLQSLGDLAQTFALRRQNVELKQQMARLTQELSSGQAADLTRHLSGSFDYLSEIEHDLRVVDSYRQAANEAQTATSVMQTALGQVQSLASNLANSAITAGSTTGSAALSAVAAEAQNGLDAMVASMNVNVAGRSLFAGTEISVAPLATADDFLTDVRAALVGATNAADVTAVLDTYFDTPGGGFETTIYQGGLTHLAPYQLGEGESVRLELRADDPGLRETLKNTVMAAISNDQDLSLSIADRHALANTAGIGLLVAQDQITGIRADLGFAESRIDQSVARLAAGLTSLEFAKGTLVAVDPYETATELENVQFQLETLYTLTARTSRLNLMNFLS